MRASDAHFFSWEGGGGRSFSGAGTCTRVRLETAPPEGGVSVFPSKPRFREKIWPPEGVVSPPPVRSARNEVYGAEGAA